jgi:hypothetical protein
LGAAVKFSHKRFLLPLALLFSAPLPAQQFHANEIYIPWNKAGPRGLNALLVYADLPGNRPLAVLTHGTSRKMEERNAVTPSRCCRRRTGSRAGDGPCWRWCAADTENPEAGPII